MPRANRTCHKVDKKTGQVCGQHAIYGGLCEEHYRQWANRSRSRFQRGSGRNSGGVITCLECGKRTRDTGHNESAHQMCKTCIRRNELENSYSDGSIDEAEYNDAIARLNAGEDV